MAIGKRHNITLLKQSKSSKTDQCIDPAEGGDGADGALLQMDSPCGEKLVLGGVASPQTLDELGGRRNLAVEVLLPLLLLNFQGETRAEDALRGRCDAMVTGYISHSHSASQLLLRSWPALDRELNERCLS